MEFRSPVKTLRSPIYLIIILFLVAGCISPGTGPSPASQTPYEMDAQCGIQELNMTFFYNWTIIPITDEDLRPFPEFAIYLQNEEPNSPVLVRSFRAVKFFSCNESRAIRFIALSQKFGDNHNPHALEYRGHYYQLSCDSYFGTTARPTTVATPVSITIPVSPALSQRTGGDYCYINELQSDFLGDSVIIPLTSKDLEKISGI